MVPSIERGLGDTRANRVVSRDAVTAAAQALLGEARGADDGTPQKPGERPVVWALTARDACLDIVRAMAKADGASAADMARRFAQAGQRLATAATGRPGRVAFTYETTHGLAPYTLVYEIVTWQKAGAVIAILAIIRDPREPEVLETPIDW